MSSNTEIYLTEKHVKLLEFLKTIKISINLSKKEKKLKTKKYQQGDLTRISSISSLDLSRSDGFFTEATLQELINILGSSEEFNNLNVAEQRVIQENLNKLNKDEYTWKAQSKGTTFEPTLCQHQLFPKAFDLFNSLMKKLLKNDSKTTKRQQQKLLHSKAHSFIIEFSKLLVKMGHPIFEEILKLSEQEISEILKEVEISWIFNNICRLVLKKGYDSTFNAIIRNSKRYLNTLTDDALLAERNNVVQDLYIMLGMYYMNLTLNYIKSLKKCRFDDFIIGKILFRHMKYKQHLFGATTDKNWWGSHCDGVMSILNIFDSCNVFELRKDTKKGEDNKPKTSLKYIIPKNMVDSSILYTKLPLVCSPEPITNDTFEEKIKPVFKGTSNITCSDKFKKTMQISQSKNFKINTTYLLLLKTIYDMPNNNPVSKVLQDFKLPFAFKQIVTENKDEEMFINENPIATPIQVHIIDQIQIILTSQKNSCRIPYKQALSITGANNAEYTLQTLRNRRNEQIMILKQHRKWGHTIIKLADIFSGFPIYISDTMCCRGRFYPEQPLISRTSGIYKHLLEDFKSTRLTTSGYISFLKAYYKPCSQSKEKFENLLKEQPNITKEKLNKYFSNNPLDLLITGDKFLYFALMHIEIEKAFKSGSTAMSIEIDQVASGVMLLSYFLRNKAMAKTANVLGGEKSDPYTYSMKQFEDFYLSHMDNRDDAVFLFLKSDRKIHKYALMCFSYAQTHVGRIDDFLEAFKLRYPDEITPEGKEVFKEFAIKYDLFIDIVFPGTAAQLSIIYDVVKLTVTELGYLPFKNLQGEKFEWSFYKYKTKTRSAYDIVTSRSKPYRSYKMEEIQIVEENSDKNKSNEVFEKEYSKKIVKDLNTFKRKCLSYFIHCIDASIIHRFILDMKEKHSNVINHLHDCVLVHPNHVENFYNIVLELYTSDELYNMSNNLFFDEICNRVSEDTKLKIKKLRLSFNERSDDFRSEIKNINPKNVYEFEG